MLVSASSRSHPNGREEERGSDEFIRDGVGGRTKHRVATRSPDERVQHEQRKRRRKAQPPAHSLGEAATALTESVQPRIHAPLAHNPEKETQQEALSAPQTYAKRATRPPHEIPEPCAEQQSADLRNVQASARDLCGHSLRNHRRDRKRLPTRSRPLLRILLMKGAR